MLTLQEFATTIDPKKTVLFLGAGASVPSGSPSGATLANQLWEILGKGAHISDDLTETCSILENKVGRPALVEAIRSILRPLQPTGGLMSLPEFEWHAIYTTNFDTLVEAAYRRLGHAVVPIRSNFEYGKLESQVGTPLYKLHGCFLSDVVDGHTSRLVLTERDYEEYADYREVLFKKLEFDLLTKDLLVIGHSLKDPHIRRDMTKAATLHQTKGSPGRLYALIYETDPDRALLMERRGFTINFGGIDEFFQALSEAKPVATPQPVTSGAFELSTVLRSSTIEVQHAMGLAPDPIKLFNGGPASYSDIRAGLTVERSVCNRLVDELRLTSKRFLTIIGVAGVGKTTLARNVVLRLVEKDYIAWEHRSDYPFRHSEWVDVERRLKERGTRGVLLIDDCPEFLRQINLLTDKLCREDDPALTVVMTAGSSQWLPRTKSSNLFKRGFVEKLSTLSELDIEAFVNLLATQPAIRVLVDPEFATMSRHDQIRRLRFRCAADMFVCLKSIFASDALDAILLREYAALNPDLQDIYRHVSALEAAGTRVHRQLVVRLLNVQADQIRAFLSLLDGLVDEFDISQENGLYGWQTRHPVIASTIARYKYANQDELFNLLKSVASNLNPTVYIELRTIRDLCSEQGIGRVTDPHRRLELYQTLIGMAPGERIPRHRLIGELLRLDDLNGAEHAIRAAEREVGLDSPISRYSVKLALKRAYLTPGIMEEDRKALMYQASNLALKGIDRNKQDKYAYFAYADVGSALAERFAEYGVLDDAIDRMRTAAEFILDPHFLTELATLEQGRQRMVQQAPTD
jgi:SIR2-like domain